MHVFLTDVETEKAIDSREEIAESPFDTSLTRFCVQARPLSSH